MRPRDDSTRDQLPTAQEPEQERPYDDAAREGEGPAATEPAATEPERTLDAGRREEYRHRWTDAQAAFVDDPRRTVDDAHRLVAEVFAARAQTLGTEDMRLLVQRYREIFDTLVTR